MNFPPMTLTQAADLANRASMIGDRLPTLYTDSDRQNLIDHATHAYKAAILLHEHATQLEQTLTTMTALLKSSTAIYRTLHQSPLWPQIEQTLLATPEQDTP